MNLISAELETLLYAKGASLVGFADLRQIMAHSDMPYGVSVAVAIPRETVSSIHGGPNMAYYDAYHRLNAILDGVVTAGASYLKANGYRAYAQTTDAVQEYGVYRTALPHKTVATNAGLGWIGKCALLVTPAYGSAVRLSSLVTDAPLDCAEPVTVSRCGSCHVCTDACPGRAVSGKLWDLTLDRDDFFDPLACRKKAREIAMNRIGKEITLCGKCIESCPYTQRYIKGTE